MNENKILQVRRKYYELVCRYLSFRYPAQKCFDFWHWYSRRENDFTDDEKEFFKKYVIFPVKNKHISDTVYIYN